MMTRKPGRSFRKLVRRGNSVRDTLWGKLTSQHKHPSHEDHKSGKKQGQDLMADQPEPSPASLRSLVLEKDDNETFGFEIMCNDSPVEDLRVAVSCVKPESPAEKAGMNPGDVLVSVNGVCVTEFLHQQITDTILHSGLIIRLETISAFAAKQMELKRKLRQLQCRLKDKSTELYLLASREEHLTGGKLGKCLFGDSLMSLSSLPEDSGSSGHSSCGSRWSACGSMDASSLSSTFDLSSSSASIRDSASGGDRHSCTFSGSAHPSKPNAPSPLAEGGSTDLSTSQQVVHRGPSKGPSKKGGVGNRLTSLFSNSRGSLADEGVQEDV
ncbi:general receptor for phosphoinositides 1-associated scaffold protein-like [Clupea harengus]|uniref:General receptor for phosphoinositides 1-associated scaffold protein-like n=1 Tax=Clupea harengus TaxID=7950 RepID=A0A6P8GHE2_CLUHA|nr:general receptor for phosphoinositides 1-associated scaffold protein-like [Clupea harengus]